MPSIFAYGSLQDPAQVRALCGPGEPLEFRTAELPGFRRHWEVPYRNGCGGGGRYRHPDGTAYQGGIAFLGVRPDPATTLRAALLEVGEAALASLDSEEYLYRRELVEVRVPGEGRRVAWLYRERAGDFPEGWYHGPSVVVLRSYWEQVTRAASALGGPGSFEATTDPCRFALADLAWTPD